MYNTSPRSACVSTRAFLLQRYDYLRRPRFARAGGYFLYLYYMAKAKKPRADKYEEKLAIDGTFDELIKVSVNYTPPKKAKKTAKKKK